MIRRCLPVLLLAACAAHDGEPIERGRHTLADTYATVGVPLGWRLDPEPYEIDTLNHRGQLRMVFLGRLAQPRAALLVGRLDSTRRLDCDEAERLAKRSFEQALGGRPSVELSCSGPGLGYVVEGLIRDGRDRYRAAARFKRSGPSRLHIATAFARDGESATRRTIALLAGVRFARTPTPEPEIAPILRRLPRRRPPRRPPGPQRVPGY